MLHVSNRALEILEEIRDASDAEDGETIILFPEDDGGIGFAVGAPSQQDQVVARDGRAVVGVAEELEAKLDGLTLDFVEGEATGQFTLSRHDPDVMSAN
jgi:hypothetical protein